MTKENFISECELLQKRIEALLFDDSVKYGSAVYAFLQTANCSLSSAERHFKNDTYVEE